MRLLTLSAWAFVAGLVARQIVEAVRDRAMARRITLAFAVTVVLLLALSTAAVHVAAAIAGVVAVVVGLAHLARSRSPMSDASHRRADDLDVVTCLRWALPASAVAWALILWAVFRG